MKQTKYCCRCGQPCGKKAIEINPDNWLCEECQEDLEGFDPNTGDPIGYDDNEY